MCVGRQWGRGRWYQRQVDLSSWVLVDPSKGGDRAWVQHPLVKMAENSLSGDCLQVWEESDQYHTNPLILRSSLTPLHTRTVNCSFLHSMEGEPFLPCPSPRRGCYSRLLSDCLTVFFPCHLPFSNLLTLSKGWTSATALSEKIMTKVKLCLLPDYVVKNCNLYFADSL